MMMAAMIVNSVRNIPNCLRDLSTIPFNRSSSWPALVKTDTSPHVEMVAATASGSAPGATRTTTALSSGRGYGGQFRCGARKLLREHGLTEKKIARSRLRRSRAARSKRMASPGVSN